MLLDWSVSPDWINDLENSIEDIPTLSMEIKIFLEAIKSAHLRALEWKDETFTWEDIENKLSSSGKVFTWWDWFRVMMFGRNAKKWSNSLAIDIYPDSKDFNDTGDFISTEFEGDITEKIIG